MSGTTDDGGPLVLVTDGWLANAGDAAIQIAMRRSLSAAIPAARVVVSCHQREQVGDRYPELDLAPPLDALVGIDWPWTSATDIAERELAERLVERADLVLVPGGGFLIERYGPEGRIRIYEELLRRGKRLIFYAQTIGEFADPELRRRLGAVLEAAELVLVRDEASFAAVTALRPSDGVRLTADEAFLLPAPRPGARAERSLLATLSLHPWEGHPALGAEDVERLAESLTRLLASGTAQRVTLASTAQGLGGPRWALEDDSIVARQVEAAIPSRWRDAVTCEAEYVSAQRYLELAARHSAAVSMRMHGTILAAVAGTPVALANGSPKARSVVSRTGDAFPGVDTAEQLGTLDEIVAPLLDAPDPVRAAQAAAVETMAELARVNARLVAERLQKASDRPPDP